MRKWSGDDLLKLPLINQGPQFTPMRNFYKKTILKIVNELKELRKPIK